ncbi:unnamed protein product [Symbiodinium necroappetens]|uniref:Uncharacterized protein n=1 Tax=Symbiodinium necroappetens TaxID=1628268 RepID=A0A812TK97_9DINO|nr:unnamed protein product [Symbiodinium necroappetens]
MENDGEKCNSVHPQRSCSSCDSVHPQRSCSSCELCNEADPEIIRGVALHEALCSWGKHWKAENGGMPAADAATYELSRQVKAYDAFLSHDWGSGRWLKLLSLLLVFNSRAAFYACLFVSIAIGFLRGFGVLPDALWTVVFSHATFFFVFAFWQRIRLLVCRPRMVFFDKLCVAQHDDALKQRGILSIAAFLLSSRSLVVLLTPQYFSRLWCTFEIATFMKDPERRKQIRFMPLKTALIFLIYSASWHVLVCCYAIFRQIRPEVYGAGAIVAAMMFGLWVVMGPVVLYLEMGMIGDIEKLPVQLRNFRVQEADCFCCTHGHRHPQTGEKIPCDRELVYKSLQKWYGEDYLETFNGRVRTYLPRSLVYGTGGFLLPIRYAVYTVLASSLPYLADPISSSFTAASELSGMALLAWVLRELVEWGLVGLCSLLSVRLSLPLCRMGLRLQMRRCTTAMILVPAIFFIILLVWAPVRIVLRWTPQDTIWPTAVCVVWLAAAICLFFPLRKKPKPALETKAVPAPKEADPKGPTFDDQEFFAV